MDGMNDYFAWKMQVQQAQFFGFFLAVVLVAVIAVFQAIMSGCQGLIRDRGFLLSTSHTFNLPEVIHVIRRWDPEKKRWVHYKNFADANFLERWWAK